jgi:phage terminase large subunit
MLKKTTAQIKIKKLRKRVRIVQGGTSSSKTFTILPILIQYAIQTPKSEISIVAESVPHLKRGALRDFIKIMDWTNNYNPNNFNQSSLTYKFTNGSYIEFFSADQPDKLRGARRDVLFINECNNIPFEAYQQLAIRTKKFIYLDYNPTQNFWVHTELIGEEDSDFIILTYKDNEALDPAIVKEIEKAKVKAETSSYWNNWWRVYGLGEIGSLEGVIFSNWQQIDMIPEDARYIGNGLDFGYSNDPTACVDFYEWNGQIIWDERIYQKGLLNGQIGEMLKDSNILTVADSAEPKSIAEIRMYGVNIIPAQKGKDSITYGINLIQERDFLVTKQSLNLIKELRGYIWKTDKAGKSLNVPIDNFNHAIDAARYFYLHKFKPNAGNYKGKTHGKIKRTTRGEYYKNIL